VEKEQSAKTKEKDLKNRAMNDRNKEVFMVVVQIFKGMSCGKIAELMEGWGLS
jgi:hypothetical protein